MGVGLSTPALGLAGEMGLIVENLPFALSGNQPLRNTLAERLEFVKAGTRPPTTTRRNFSHQYWDC